MSNNQDNTGDHSKATGRFVKGNQARKGKGKPSPTRDLVEAAAFAVTPSEVRSVLIKLKNLALEGDTAAARILLERTLGKPSEAKGVVELPSMESANDLKAAMSVIVQACASGDLAPEMAVHMAKMIDQVRKTFATTELAEQIEALLAAQGIDDSDEGEDYFAKK